MMRNFFCLQYTKCLDLAARRDRDFTCQGCGRYRPISGPDREDSLWHSIEACKLLLVAVLCPEVWQEINRLWRASAKAGRSESPPCQDMDPGEISALRASH
jgi:hypothetical protein